MENNGMRSIRTDARCSQWGESRFTADSSFLTEDRQRDPASKGRDGEPKEEGEGGGGS